MLKFLFFFVSLIACSFCYDPVLALLSEPGESTQIESDPIGKGFILTEHDSVSYNNLTDSLDCLKHENFDTGFVYLYAGERFLDYNVPWVESLEEEGMKVQYMMQPSASEKSAIDIFNKFFDGLVANNITVDFLWIDTLALNGEYPEDNLKLFNDIQASARKSGIVVGIRTTQGSWVYSLKNPTTYSNQLLWLDTIDGPSFTGFVPFGGWTSSAALTGKTQTKCVTSGSSAVNTMSVLYRRDEIDDELAGSTVAPPPVPSENPANYGNALTISIGPNDPYWSDFDKSISCIKQNYDSVFLYLFNGKNYIEQAEDIALRILNAGLNLQFVIKPETSYENFDVSNVVQTVLDGLQGLNLQPAMIWLDTNNFAYTPSDDNIAHLNQFTSLFNKHGIKLQITSRLQQWIDYFDDVKTFSTNGVLLWDDQELNNEASFIPYGGWKSVSVFTYKASNNCSNSPKSTNYKFLGSTYKKDRLDFSMVPRSTIAPIVTDSTNPTDVSGRTASPLGRGIVIEPNGSQFEDLYMDMQCYARNNYNTIFLYALENGGISTQLLDILGLLKSFPFNVQFVIKPKFVDLDVLPLAIVQEVIYTINYFGYQPQFFWIDVGDAKNSNSTSINIEILKSYTDSIQASGLDFGIATSKDVWMNSFPDYDEVHDKLLWEVSDFGSFSDFNPFSNWTDLAVLSVPYTGMSCPDVRSYFTYRDALYQTSQLNFNLPPVPTENPTSESTETTTSQFDEATTTKSSSTLLSNLFLSLPILYFSRLL